MIDAVDQIADVVQVSGNAGKLHGVGIVAEHVQKGCRFVGNLHNVCKTVFGKAQCGERLIRPLNVCADIRILLQGIKCDHILSSLG
ncbi:unknown [Clostridium sp. CAG:448]|nr:unknown [Clostridium sp. CAG:448]